MSLALLAPLGLLALGALLLPLLLHLARRTPQRRTDFAALRWLAARLRPRRRLRVEEPWLLLVRLLLVACVALLFARPVWTARDAGTPWVLVHPSVGPAQAREALGTDTPADIDWHWLAPGFPELQAPPPAGVLPVASLLREADARLAAGTRLTVVLPRELDGLDAERPRLARPVRWLVVANAARAASATTAAGGLAAASPVIALRGGATAQGRRYLLAAARANGWRVDDAPADAPPPSRALSVLWLDATRPPAALMAWVRGGGTLWLASGAPALPGDPRTLARDDRGDEVVAGHAHGRGRVLQWRQPLAPEALPLLLEPAFPRLLAEVLLPPPDPSRAYADAFRPRVGAPAYPPTPRPLDPWLAALAILLFALERGLATRAGRGGPA